MRNLPRIALQLVAVAMMATPMMGMAQAPQQGNQVQQSTNADWRTPPPGAASSQQGYRDGVVAANLDKLATRPIDPKESHLYVHPPVKKDGRDVYRSGFVAGYQAALQHQNS
jgi:hypothetical protein